MWSPGRYQTPLCYRLRFFSSRLPQSKIGYSRKDSWPIDWLTAPLDFHSFMHVKRLKWWRLCRNVYKKKLGFFWKQKLEKAVNQEIQNIFLSVEPFKWNWSMNANLYYDCNGESWTILDFHSSITFSSERGLKQAINRKINRDLESGNLRRHFGTGSRVNVNVYCKELGFTEKPLATTHVNVYWFNERI